MWSYTTVGEKQFNGGKSDWISAKKAAQNCPDFKLDDEDELVSDDITSCYNCRYRKWDVESFICLKP